MCISSFTWSEGRGIVKAWRLRIESLTEDQKINSYHHLLYSSLPSIYLYIPPSADPLLPPQSKKWSPMRKKQ